MKKRSRLFWVLPILLLGGAGFWFWSLGSVAAEPLEGITLTVERPVVHVKAAGSEEWKEVSGNVMLKESDQVRTSDAGRATIQFFGMGETRLRENSSVLIEMGSHDPERPTMVSVNVKLLSGRVWSRVLRLFDLDSSFAVKTDSVIATVRGTAFDMEVNTQGTWVWVSDSAVEMEGGGQAMMVPEGFKAMREQGGTWHPKEAMTNDDQTSDWFVRNASADDSFAAEASSRVAAQFSRGKRVRADSPWAGLAGLSERLHLAVSAGHTPQLAGHYFGRRLYGIKTLIEDGKSGLALQALTALEQDVRKTIKTDEGKKAVPFFRAAIAELMVVLQDVGPESPLYRLKQRLEDLGQLLTEGDDAASLHARLHAVDTRLDESILLIGRDDLEAAMFSLDAARQGIRNSERDVEGAAGRMGTARTRALRSKLQALKAREAVIGERLLRAATPELPGSATSTPPTPTATTTPAERPPTVVPAPVPPQSTAPWTMLTFTAAPNPLTVGKTAGLRVIASTSDGKTVDVTSRASFYMVGEFGSLNGPTFTARQPGSAIIEATVMDRGVSHSARTVVQINEAGAQR